jgi:hypothetical protein
MEDYTRHHHQYDTWRADQEDEQSDIGEYLEQVVYQLREATKPMLYVLFPID